MPVDGQAVTEKRTFSRTTSVSLTIDAPPAAVWKLLTDAQHYPDWNSTIVSLKGNISPEGKLELVSTLDPSRTFKLKIKDFNPPTRLVWGDALGQRTYTLSGTNAGQTLFEMTEKIGGPVFPLFASRIPPFDASFEQFAADLKAAAERAA
ncbi:SRPBCC domain-containing protein [Paenarthrobacter sp. S56]|uniref:SRPBCC domain-containing protein n=1 Tax=Paenarthrobacter sp. S56 TaxID=3138179 RepID=UPI00321C1C9A